MTPVSQTLAASDLNFLPNGTCIGLGCTLNQLSTCPALHACARNKHLEALSLATSLAVYCTVTSVMDWP